MPTKLRKLFQPIQTPDDYKEKKSAEYAAQLSGLLDTGKPNEVSPKAKDMTDEPKQSDFNWYQENVAKYFEKPMTEEEQNRRARAASAVEGIGNLGNILNAFSNLVFVGKGAPNQVLPTAPKSELDKFEDRVREQRMKYASSMMGLRNADRAEYQNAWDRWNAEQQRAIAQANADRAYKLQVDRYNKEDELHEEEQNYKRSQDAKELELQSKNQQDANALAWARLNQDIAEFNARKEGGYYDYSNRGYGGRSNSNLDVMRTSDGRYIQLDRRKMGDSDESLSLKQLYNLVPDNIKEKYAISKYDDAKIKTDNTIRAIAEAAEKNPEIGEYIIKSGIGSYISGEEAAATTTATSAASQDEGGFSFIEGENTSNANGSKAVTIGQSEGSKKPQEGTAPRNEGIEAIISADQESRRGISKIHSDNVMRSVQLTNQIKEATPKYGNEDIETIEDLERIIKRNNLSDEAAKQARIWWYKQMSKRDELVAQKDALQKQNYTTYTAKLLNNH